MRIRSWPSAGAAGKLQKSGPRARSTNSRPSKQLPAIRLVDGVRPAKDQTTSADGQTPILAATPAPGAAGPARTIPAKPRHARGSEPQPATAVQPHEIFTPPRRPQDTRDWWLISGMPVSDSRRPVMWARIWSAVVPFPLSRPRNRVCHVHAACRVAGAGSAGRGGDRGYVRQQEDGAAAGGADP